LIKIIEEMVNQVDDILKIACTYHRKLSDHYLMMQNNTEDQREILFLDYLIRQEKLREEYIRKNGEIVHPELLSYWIKCTPRQYCASLQECFNQVKKTKIHTLNEVVELAVVFDNCLIEIYKALESQASSEEVKTLFKCSHQMAMHDEMDLVRDSQWLKDL